MKNWSIKTRVSLFYCMFLLGIAALMVLFLFLTTDSAAQNISESTLQKAVKEAANGISYYEDHIEIDPDFDFYAKGSNILLYGPKGTPLAGNAPSGFPAQVPLVSDSYQSVKNGEDSWLVYDLLIHHPDASSLWIRGVYPMDNTAAALHFLHRVGLIALPILVLTAMVGGWLVTKRAFAPLEKIRRAAAEISAGDDLSLRIELGQTKDELYDLSVTLNQMIERLQKAFENERQFSSDVSHELRTPITVILSQCDYALEKGHTPEEYQKTLESIQIQGKRMSALCAQLLELSQNFHAANSLQKEEVNLSLLCESICEEMSTAAGKKQIQLESHIQENLIAQVDEIQWMRLMINLISNAIRYGKEHGTIQVFLEDSSASEILLKVQDDGPGIPEEQQDKIFTRFYRADNRQNPGSEGSFGLGLSYVKWIAEAHGGSVTLDSKPGAGSTFTVRLPR
ncbi:sensor histidine kinase [Hominifimenecus sp. rT4P-3]|uniref:sensor histidine kinase n=1 Tax=Hominifimenecus sp. rT4P-3 TaxID=3242979 RepID=UPI003DA4F77C